MMNNLERLVYMANQIARNFEAMGIDGAAAATADHIVTYWDPRMKDQIADCARSDPGALTPVARAAVGLIAGGRPAAPPRTRATMFNAVDEAGRSDAG